MPAVQQADQHSPKTAELPHLHGSDERGWHIERPLGRSDLRGSAEPGVTSMEWREHQPDRQDGTCIPDKLTRQQRQLTAQTKLRTERLKLPPHLRTSSIGSAPWGERRYQSLECCPDIVDPTVPLSFDFPFE